MSQLATTPLRITGGTVYDPANSIDGEQRDVLIADGRIVNALPDGASPRTINARGMVIMPGGVDIHCHIASASANRARAMQGEEHASHVHRADPKRQLRSGTGVLTPSTFTTGYRYAALGYTTALEAAVAPSSARQSHLELDDTPNLDAGFLLLTANHQHVIELLAHGDDAAALALVAHMLRKTGAYGIKVVNPGGVAAWRHDARQSVIGSIDDCVAGTPVTPRRIIALMCAVAEKLKLPHPPHIHCNRLGVPGNVDITRDTLRALDGRRAHLTHLQFHAYAKTSRGDFASGAQALCEYLNEHGEITADVGQVMFGDAMTLTADTPLEHMLYRLTGKRYASIETELETGCGLMPITYKDTSYLHTLQWAIGLELMLCSTDPWRMLLSTDHPNGGSFLTYPAIIAALMSKAVRDEHMSKANARALRQTRLKDLSRELTLSEVAVITRAGPARALGLTHKGHLGAGADADVTIYDHNLSDVQAMFSSPRHVIKAGQALVEDGELRAAAPGRRMRAAVEPDDHGQALLQRWFTQHGSYHVSQFGMREHELTAMRAVKRNAH